MLRHRCLLVCLPFVASAHGQVGSHLGIDFKAMANVSATDKDLATRRVLGKMMQNV